ncbi:hypothetical protein A3A03_03130 [Candidatus Nomurabacteria bacterium RIFCSPLOWO2_01_FULL_40_18]|uniref:Uncharacterized protein n=1 Tax=Candidatus Nomurabacteria bacterium RIFCSPLOWO2_01_FULL_40_18 TaxID=1801773 RepID=A0A1F6XJ96_9BACT|nr:MAG: hypothetical protein A3A03_03130 [Candidatus Nomurabacteria bacterium RIFCSPLOWO2_01_FULL_40_18]
MNNKKTKKVTTADLAKMIKKDVVDRMATKDDLKDLEARMDTKIDTKIEEVKSKIEGINNRIDDFVMTRVKYEDHNKLKLRVEKLELKAR